MSPFLWVHIHIHIQIHIHDVVRRTNTTLDVLLDSRIDEYWNVDGDRELSWPWCGFTQSTILNEKPPNGYTWFWERLAKVQATSRDDFLWLEVLSNMSKRSHKKEERQREIIEKPKLDSARQLRGCCFIHPGDMEFNNTMTHSRNKLEVPLESAMPCRVSTMPRNPFVHTTVLEKHDTHVSWMPTKKKTDRASGTTQPRDDEDLIAERGSNSSSHHNFVHKPIPFLQAMKILDAKAAADKELEKLRKLPAWQVTKVKSKKEVIEKARKEGRTVHFATSMDLCHLKNSELELKFQKYNGRVVLQGDVVKDDSGSYAVFKEQGSSAS